MEAPPPNEPQSAEFRHPSLAQCIDPLAYETDNPDSDDCDDGEERVRLLAVCRGMKAPVQKWRRHAAPQPRSRLRERSLVGVLWNVVRYRKGVILSSAALAAVVAAGIVLVVPTWYTAQASLFIETQRGTSSVAAPDRPQAESQIDSTVVESQLAFLGSEAIARRVMDTLELWQDAEFANRSNLRGEADAHIREEADRTAAVEQFKKQTAITRLGRSYVAIVTFSSRDPGKAARIANAIAAAYIDEVFAAKAQTAHRTADWLAGRIAELRQRMADASRRVEEFKSANNLVVDVAGRLSSERELENLSEALAKARAETLKARARLELSQAVLKASPKALDTTAQVVPEELTSPLIQRLRQQTIELSRQLAEWKTRPNAPPEAVQNLNSEMKRIGQLVTEEVQRMTAAYASDLNIAAAQEKAIEGRILEVFQRASANRQNLGKLRELEAEAQSAKVLHDAALARHAQFVDEQTYPVTGARLVSPSSVPALPASPKRTLIVVLAGLLGAVFGVWRAERREARVVPVRAASDLRRETGLPVIGVVDSERKYGLSQAKSRLLQLKDRHETLRRVKVMVDEQCRTPCCVIAITSAEPAAGKSTLAANLAALIAAGGETVLLLDGDGRATTSTGRLSHVFSETSDIPSATRGGFDFATIGSAGDKSTAGAPGKARLRDRLEEARNTYRYVVIDFPAAREHLDVRVAAPLLDAVVFVAAWGTTSTAELLECAASSEPIRNRIAGVVINKAP